METKVTVERKDGTTFETTAGRWAQPDMVADAKRLGFKLKAAEEADSSEQPEEEEKKNE